MSHVEAFFCRSFLIFDWRAQSIVLAQTSGEASVALPPPAALVLDAVPPVPATLAADVARYTEYKPTGFASWHPKRMEMLVARRHQNTAQLFALTAPGAKMELRTDFAEPVRGASRQPQNKGGGESDRKSVV